MRKEMETNNDEEIKKLIKKVYPHMMALAKDKVCPSEDALASFAEGKLKGKKEEQVISHLAFCNDCLEMIKFLRQAPSAEEVSVPLWLEETARDLFPEKPKTWEIVVGHAKTALEVIKHTAEGCWTLPGLELIPAKIKPEPAYLHELGIAYTPRISDENQLAKSKSIRRFFRRMEDGSVVKGTHPVEPKRTLPEEGERSSVHAEMVMDNYWVAPVPISATKDKILKSLKKRISNGLVFIEHIGPYDVYVAIIKKEDKRADVFEVEIEVYDRLGRSAEEIEVSFTQGRRTIAKLVTRKEARISKRLSPKKYSVKLKHKGLYLGQALLDLREENPKQSGRWD
jgi:hypothetical protein